MESHKDRDSSLLHTNQFTNQVNKSMQTKIYRIVNR